MPYYDNILEFEPNLDGADLRIGIVMSRFNIDVGEGLLSACTAELKKNNVQDSNILLVTVPGALEIPLALKRMALSDQFDALIALGAVIRGETSHYDYVCNAVERGCSDLQLRFGRPVVFGVLTIENEEQAFDRVGGKHGHKGVDAAHVLLEMIDLKAHLKVQSHT